jgi:membrane protein
MWLSCVAVLLGAEINAEAEHQTDSDSTVGPDLPRGSRRAVKADDAVGRPLDDDRDDGRDDGTDGPAAPSGDDPGPGDRSARAEGPD